MIDGKRLSQSTIAKELDEAQCALCDLCSISDGEYAKDPDLSESDINSIYAKSYSRLKSFMHKYFPKHGFDWPTEYMFFGTSGVLQAMEEELAAGTYVPEIKKMRLALTEEQRKSREFNAIQEARGKYVDMLYRTAHASKKQVKSVCKLAFSKADQQNAINCIAYACVSLADFVSEHYYEMQDDYCRELAVSYSADPLKTKEQMLAWKAQNLIEIAEEGVIDLANRKLKQDSRILVMA